MPFHHVAYATRDLAATTRFYEELMGFPLVHTELQGKGESWIRHVFFDTGEGQCIAFFELNRVGEQPDYATDVSAGVGLPTWVNHVAFQATADQQAQVRARMNTAGFAPFMEQDHGWCHSLYYLDPNGIMVELCRNTPGFEANPAEAHRLASGEPHALLAAQAVSQ
jgi:catechol 2,3-dioxygenase-like lactoylglutathione lyase family enzyme